MKKLFYLLIGVISLLAACTAEPAMDTTAAVYADKDKVIADINEQSMGTFDMSWIVKKQVVDTATLSSKGKNIVISHLPVKYFTWNLLDFVNQYPGDGILHMAILNNLTGLLIHHFWGIQLPTPIIPILLLPMSCRQRQSL